MAKDKKAKNKQSSPDLMKDMDDKQREDIQRTLSESDKTDNQE